ncbi:MAG: RNA polymerase sigma factor [bacterium]|nr:RNA polymerase sigma factor [bacterium]
MIWDESKEKELEKIFERFSNFIKSNIYKYDPNKYGLEIDDILQDVKIKIWKIIHNEKKIKNLSSYIKKVVESSVIDQFRRYKREEGVYLYEKNKQIADQNKPYTTESVYEEMDIKDLIGKAVEGLIETRRKAVKLYLLNLSIDEIALYFNWSKHKTRNLLYRGLSDLKKLLKEKNIDYENNS